MARRKKPSGGGSNWMDTYGDMVTLLLCFFVLLYSMSSLDSNKWEILVKSFNPDADKLSQIVTNTTETDGTYDVSASLTTKPKEVQEFEDLYYTLAEYVAENSLSNDITVSAGEGFTFITFSNNIFFDGDSYSLKPQGMAVLDDLVGPISEVSGNIAEMQILGHTSQADPKQVNESVSDRFLASNRATVVLVYLQQKGFIDPAKLVSSGYGQFRPISPFDTRENRSKNRRVEILITKDDGVTRSLEEYYNQAVPITEENVIIE